jgi:hypothetical protein
MSQPLSVTQPTHLHTLWRPKTSSRLQRLIERLTRKPDTQGNLGLFLEYRDDYSMKRLGHMLCLMVPLADKSPEERRADLHAEMKKEGLSKYWEFATQALSTSPNEVDERLYNAE